jgi:two-component system NtrC family sensor kinase
MAAASKAAPVDEYLEHSHLGLRAIAGMGPIATILALLVWAWGQWSVFAAVAAVGVSVTLANVWLVTVVARRHGRPTAEAVRVVANVTGIIVYGHYTQWTPLVWSFVPYNLLWFYMLDRWVLHRLFTYLTLLVGFSLWDRAPLERVLAFVLLGTFSCLLTARRLRLLREAVAHEEEQRKVLEKAYQQLRHAHEQASAQEKLSSLGMMAAGVAHEINNPMSFVTSNLSLLLKDLKQQPSLPAPLQEYVDEVLPETLEGIKRVNAIVAALRRFARGDPETYAEYDLNEQVRSALRITHGQLGHCRVEEQLGEVGTLVGRPQQIVQVLVNMLINAGQATAAGGQVRVSTQREGDGARVEIHDTGAGLSPEARKHLFEPFFTTRPHGTGMGLGLAVAHGIVTGHGGRIEVDSQPGQGTCFTVHLPHSPPRPDYHRPPQAAASEGTPLLN